MFRNWQFWGVLGSAALGAVLRLVNLGAEPFLGDEVLSLDIARHFSRTAIMLQYIREVEFHPPLYYLFLRAWTHFFGASEFAARLPSAIFGTATILLVYFVCRRVFQSRSTALLAAFFVAILPMQIEFSHEARPYIIFSFFGLLAAWSLWEYRASRKLWLLCGYAAASIVGLYLHYSYGFILIALALWWLARARTSAEFVRWLVAHAAIALGFAWWLPAVFYKLLLGREKIFGLSSMWIFPRPPDFFSHSLERLIWLNKESLVHPFLGILEFAVLAGFIYAAAASAGGGGIRAARRELVFCLCLVFVPIALFVFSPFSVPYTPVVEQHVLFVTIPLVFLAAHFILTLPGRKAAALGAIFAISLLPFIAQVAANEATSSGDYQLAAMSGYINEHFEPGDMVVIADTFTRTDLNHFLRPELSAIGLRPAGYFGLDIWNSRSTLGLIENEYQRRVTQITAAETAQKLDHLERLYHPNRIWLAYFYRDDSIHAWFLARRARHAFLSQGPLFPLDLYVLPPK